jgi:hypothetical protein
VHVDTIVAALKQEIRSVVWPGRETLEALSRCARRSSSNGHHNLRTAFALATETAGADIQAEIDPIRLLGRSFE